MIKQYTMGIEDANKFKDIKESSLYKDYINTIINSPILVNIANEHIKHIDITDDIEDILAHNSSAKKLNTLFKDTIKNVAINMIADSLIINDIIDVSFNDSIEDMEDNFKVKYLLGLADEEYYTKAEAIIDKEPDTSSLIYIGYAEYKKRKDKDTLNKFNITAITSTSKPKTKVIKKTSKKKTVDISSNDIDF